MQPPRSIPVWAQAPFLRLLPPWITGILLQWYTGSPYIYPVIALCCFLAGYLLFYWLPAAWQFQWHTLRGCLLQLMMTAAAMLITWKQDTRNHPQWWAHHYRAGDALMVYIDAVPEEKQKSCKAGGTVSALVRNNRIIPCKGRILLYLDKNDRRLNSLRYGDEMLFRRRPQAIRNSGNPGAFNYAQYAAFQGLFHQVFLPAAQWETTGRWTGSRFRRWLFEVRSQVLAIVRSHITGKQEAAIAEALLIGYTLDLDKDLVQAYSNTGAVHIIAISGMHLGLIYGLLYWLFTCMPMIRKQRRLQALLILSALWLFALLAGGSASVIRSAVMFSFLTTGRFIFNRSSTFNALAGSAFVLLAFNPYYCWDIGFQLSYTAVTGIVLFQRPLYNILYLPYKLPDLVWKTTSITLAAQVLTFPLCIYYFHQFPLSFLISNLVAVPVSSLILYLCMGLLLVSWQRSIAEFTGALISFLLRGLNRFILWVNDWPLAVWDRIPAGLISTLLLYGVVIGMAAWLMKRMPGLLISALGLLTVFLAVHGVESWQAAKQQRIIIYNIPKHQAIDFVQGNRFRYVGDSIPDAAFHLKPARTIFRMYRHTDSLPGLLWPGPYYQLGNRRLVIVTHPPISGYPDKPLLTDYLLLSRNPEVKIDSLIRHFRFRKIIIDATNPLWKIEQWKQACDRLHLQCHPVTDQGAFLSD